MAGLNTAADEDECAAQILDLDTCLGALLEFLDESPVGRETLLIVMGAHGPLVHVPLMVKAGGIGRSQALVEPSDLWATLLEWFSITPQPASPTAKSLLPIVRDEISILRQRLGIRGESGERALRIPGWYLRFRESETRETGETCQLFAKPDDLWEVNNVADRCQEIVEAMRQELAAYCQSFATGGPQNLPPLDDLLLAGPG